MTNYERRSRARSTPTAARSVYSLMANAMIDLGHDEGFQLLRRRAASATRR